MNKLQTSPLTIRARLMERRRELRERLGRVERDLAHAAAPLEPDFAEQAVQRENDATLGAIDDSLVCELSQIDRAVDRLDRGLYGLCENCGGQIEPARLQAVTDATACVRCNDA